MSWGGALPYLNESLPGYDSASGRNKVPLFGWQLYLLLPVMLG